MNLPFGLFGASVEILFIFVQYSTEMSPLPCTGRSYKRNGMFKRRKLLETLNNDKYIPESDALGFPLNQLC